jgi:excisionase family DNA binding protein
MEKLAFTIDEAAELGGPRNAKLYEDIKVGRLRAVKFGRSTRILVDDLKAYLTAAPPIEPKVLPSQTRVASPRRVKHRTNPAAPGAQTEEPHSQAGAAHRRMKKD